MLLIVEETNEITHSNSNKIWKFRSMSQICSNAVMQLMKEACPSSNYAPSKFSDAEKLVRKLGLTSVKIDCCINGCMLYYKNDAHLQQCKFCDALRYRVRKSKKRRKQKDVPLARMHYLAIITRLERLFASHSSD